MTRRGRSLIGRADLSENGNVYKIISNDVIIL